MLAETAVSFPWSDIVSGGGIGAFLFALWMFLKHLKEVQAQNLAASERKNATVEKVSTEFSTTVRAVSNDVKVGIDKMNETTATLLADSREREAKLHELFRSLAEKRS